jgi:flagellar motor switch protein FliN
MAGLDKDDRNQDAPPEAAQAESDKQTGNPKPEAPKSSKAKDMPDNKLTGNMDFLLDIPLEISVELGQTKMLINELLKLGQGSVIELSKLAGETLEILANQKLIARGEVVVVNEKYGVRLTEIISPSERIERLK